MRFLENKIPNSTAPKIAPVREYDMPDQETEMDKKILRMLNEFIAEGNALKALVEEDIYVRLGATIQAVEDLQLQITAITIQYSNDVTVLQKAPTLETMNSALVLQQPTLALI
jgi:hypothetical protein